LRIHLLLPDRKQPSASVLFVLRDFFRIRPQQGGAIVSVDATGRLDDAERILERNHGQIRYEAAPESAQWNNLPGERVRVFGRLSRAYPESLTGANTPARKAS
jgi:hypothetical protein